jgi:hypothetical protein
VLPLPPPPPPPPPPPQTPNPQSPILDYKKKFKNKNLIILNNKKNKYNKY